MTRKSNPARETYNGWSNRETWLVNLWLTNDERTYNATRGMTAGALQATVEERIEDNNIDGFLTDLLYAACARVDWSEIAMSLSAD
jgi:hypothetical protein